MSEGCFSCLDAARMLQFVGFGASYGELSSAKHIDNVMHSFDEKDILLVSSMSFNFTELH